MRTSGTFQDVYEAAKQYSNGIKTYGGCPMNPVIRRENGRWMLESDMNSGEDADFQVTLEIFNDWFYESYKNDDYIPSESDIQQFIEA
jgi:hypothetical protein